MYQLSSVSIYTDIFTFTALKEIEDSLQNWQLYHIGNGDTLTNSKNFLDEISKHPKTPIDTDFEKRITDKFLYIYTSGTTGLPKAAILTHAR